ncbi:zf-TFIIB domain-containing protein [Pseudoalteromonas haloplanktis]|uniref:Zf-TFIIB domain-containing protein n=1 Tax=Pseudoalteromonas haloplanktis TaxID=228 RepID=A0ABU1B9H5_PSEHA|nr:zf-TFIIB domain-containing protein [Pseudoalteromonas haloplanktis]MDQ9090297.1 zf-TFIIB domain-containing protein [Pseudoalteromonas haloplanktis]
MHCPRTHIELTKLIVGGIEVYSSSNGGVFFDNRQITNFSDPTLKRALVLAEHLAALPDSDADLSSRINCPKCPSIVMMRRFFTPLHVVEIDECPNCAGIWLDPKELNKIHENHLSAREKQLLLNQQMNDHGFVQFDIPTNRFSRQGLKKNHNDNTESLVELALASLFDK